MKTRSFLTFAFVGFTALSLSACGFSPVYGTYAGSAATKPAASMANISIANIPDRSGQKLRNLLIDRMYKGGHPGEGALYKLDVSTIKESIYGLGIAKDATATRSQIRLSTTMVLKDQSGEKKYINRYLSAVSSFNTLASQYTTLVTEEDARDQTIRDLGEQIITQLELYFNNPSAFPDINAEEDKEEKDAQSPQTSY